MTIIFYKTLSKPNEINKVLQNSFKITGSFKTDTDVIKPIIKVLNTTDFNIFNYNYCYISELKRYYFVEDISILADKLFFISLSLDVLYTYKNTILSSVGNISRYSQNVQSSKKDTIEDYIENEILLANPFSETGTMVMSALNGQEVIQNGNN